MRHGAAASGAASPAVELRKRSQSRLGRSGPSSALSARWTPALGLVLVLALCQGLLWAAFTAPLNGPDEAEHAAYVQAVAETGRGPKRVGGTGSYSTELSHLRTELGLAAMRGHPEAKPDFGALPRIERELAALPDGTADDGTGPSPVAQNPPLYYWVQAVVYRLSPERSLLGRLFAMRAANVLLYVATVLFTWLLAGDVFRARWQRLLATVAVALQPKLVAMGAVINPDSLLYAASAGFLWMSVRVLLRGPSLTRLAALAGFVAAGVLTHGRGFFLLPALGVVLLLAVLRFRPSRTRALQAGVGTALVVGLAVAVAAAWTQSGSGGAAFGGEVGQQAGFNARQFVSYVFQFYFGPLGSLQPLGPAYGYRQVYIETFLGGFGSLEVTFPTVVYDYAQIAAAVGIAALVVGVAARWDSVRRIWYLWVAALCTFGSLLLVLHVSAYRDLAVGGDPLLTGRYLLPAVALYGLAIGWVFGSLPRWIGVPLAGAMLAVLVILAGEALLLQAGRFYV